MNTKKTKPLIFIPSARDLPDFVPPSNYDKLWVKYFDQQEAYTVGRQWFLEHEEYTHLVIVPDDLITTNLDIERLMKTSKYGYTASGWCVHGKSFPDRAGLDSNISFTIPDKAPINCTYEEYHFIPIVDIESMMGNDQIVGPIEFCGFAPTMIPRKIVTQIPFRADHGCCVDSCFSQDLKDKGFVQLADLRVKTVEIKATDTELLQVGKKEKKVIFESV